MRHGFWQHGAMGLMAAACMACGGDDEPARQAPAGTDGGVADDAAAPPGPSDAGADARAPQGPVASAGVAQKGPFLEGGTLKACALQADGSDDPARCASALFDDSGHYDLGVLPWSGATSLEARGFAFDEVTGVDGTDELRLAAVVDANVSVLGNVNLFSHFEAARVRTLMGAGAAFAEARTRAQLELSKEIGLAGAPTDLEFFPASGQRSDDDTSLLLFSVLAAQTNLGQEDYDELAADFADDGFINGEGASTFDRLGEDLSNDDAEDLIEQARLHLQARYGVVEPFTQTLVAMRWGDPCKVRAWRDPNELCESTPRDVQPIVTTADFRFQAAIAGSHVFTASRFSCSQFTWTARVAGSTIGSASGGAYTTAEARLTTRLEPGVTVTFTIAHQCPDTQTPRLNVKRISDGSPSAPFVLKPGKTKRTQIGAWAGASPTNVAYYAMPVSAGTHTALLTEYTVGAGNPGMSLALFDGMLVDSLAAFTGAPLASQSASSQTSVSLQGTTTGDALFFRVTNANAKSSVSYPGDESLIDYLFVTAIP